MQNALEAGAVGYLLKNAPINTLADAIRSVYAGQPVLSPEATAALIRTKTGPLKPGNDLSEREREVLALIVQGLSNEEIAETAGDQPGHGPASCQRLPPEAGRGQSCAGRGPGDQTPPGFLTLQHSPSSGQRFTKTSSNDFSRCRRCGTTEVVTISRRRAERPDKNRPIGPCGMNSSADALTRALRDTHRWHFTCEARSVFSASLCHARESFQVD